MTVVDAADPRTLHYGDFYGITDLPGDAPVALVVGNCQAESLRLFLGEGLRSVRMPAVHELVAADLPHLERWLSRASVLITQPIRDGYHGLPLGSAQLSGRLPAGALVVRVPVIRFAGLYPAHAIVRPPTDPSLTPPLVEYHDLRILAEAAGLSTAPAVDAVATRAIAELSLGELRRREAAHATVPVSDLFERPSFAQMRTLNHPGNPVWTAVAQRVREAICLPGPAGDPGRPVLTSIHAPREAAVIEAWGLDDEPTDDWVVGGRSVDGTEVREAHLRWYADNPDVVEAGLARHGEALGVLGLA
ncbi:hypothetical protein EDF46_2427 [Frondihabitans sp. PhB188]|uniref:WcbI family polysaccharide biosynthesis putative acetyltransferase n=1 Tax=Frondihabitans sp. PhB188 TaxID=2485200 RepID=UPI000F4A7354|nr:WcbI family polysaccharide biosynthesis putative acetyltransferase [Frondihabitans sp. PhB188]ROQ38783.1 hypothetical protein EDF46_2427 [Frondihabitans sp. PhB188]